MLRQINYIIFDAARMGGLMEEARERNNANNSLYRGDSETSLSAVAPYLFQFSCPTPFSDWYLDNGWGDAWGILLKTSWPMQEVHKHFRKFLLVKTEAGEELYFRFYDPRVLRIFLPTCDAAQIRKFFGPIDYFLMEDDDPAFALRFRHENGILKQERLRLDDISQRSAASLSTEIPGGIPSDNVRSADEHELPVKPKSKWNMFD